MIPLPDQLAGVNVERTVVIDRALLYLLNAAITALVDRNRYSQTGALTVDDAIQALETTIEAYRLEP